MFKVIIKDTYDEVSKEAIPRDYQGDGVMEKNEKLWQAKKIY